MTAPVYWQVKAWVDDTKTTLLATIINTFQAHSVKETGQIGVYDLTLPLSDSGVGTIAKGSYIEITIGYSSPALWLSGYVQKVTKTVTQEGLAVINLADALWFLSDFRALDSFAMNYPMYLNALDAINGTNDPGTSALPGQKGILSGTGWVARWLDPTAPAHATTASAVSVGDTAVTVGSTSGFTARNAFKIGNDFYQITNVNSGTNISIHPKAYASYGGGAACGDMGYQLPGAGDTFFTALQTPMANMVWLANQYHFYWRSKLGSMAHSGTIEMGPLSDPSGLSIWGELPLRDDLQTNHGINLPYANVGFAQQFGYAVIDGPSFEDDTSHILNVLWAVGHGKGKDEVTLRTIFGDVSGITPTQYWTGGRNYYLGPTKAHWSGNTYRLIAAQRQDGTYEYGVANTTSIAAYGVHETAQKFAQCKEPNVLLSTALSVIDLNSDAVPSWVFPVQHPRTSASGIPASVQPGQTIDVHYSGQVQTAGGTVTYLTFPGTSDPNKIAKLNRCTRVEESYDPDTGYTATYTMGHGKRYPAHWRDALARQFEHSKYDPNHKHVFKKRLFDHVLFALSQNPDAWEDPTDSHLYLSPGAIAVSDVPDSNFFDDHHVVSFLANISDANGILDVWFAKKIDGTVTGIASSATYGVLRLAFSASSVATGFYQADTAGALTAKGTLHRTTFTNAAKRLPTGQWRVGLRFKGGRFEATLEGQDPSLPSGILTEYLIASWLYPGTSNWGAIGFRYQGVSGNATLSALHAHAHHHQMPAKGSVNIAEISASHPSGHRRQPAAVSTGHGLSIGAETPS